MDGQIKKILAGELKKSGFKIATDSIRLFERQGWMSSVFLADSGKGPLIIHKVNLIGEHKKNRIWEKFKGFTEIFKKNPQIPTSEILYSGLIGDSFFLVQNFLPGEACGKRILEGSDFRDEWHQDEKAVVPKILSALSLLHRVKFEGFGWPVLKDRLLQGPHQTWTDFFQTNLPHWLKIVLKADRRLSFAPIEGLEKFFKERVKKIGYGGPAVLVHGDAINPGNILLEKGNIFLLDWEWAIFADPAWEFCDIGWWNEKKRNLSAYFETGGMSEAGRRDFVDRIELYIPFWLLWSAWHAEDADPKIYVALRKLLWRAVDESV